MNKQAKITIIAASCALLGSLALPSSAHAKDGSALDLDPELALGALGIYHFVALNLSYHHKAFIEDTSSDRVLDDQDDTRWSPALEFNLAVTPLPTIFRSMAGLEVNVRFGTPLRDAYYGGLSAEAGMIIDPVVLGNEDIPPLRAGVTLGAGFNAQYYLYIKPHVAFAFGEAADVELSYRIIPSEYASYEGDNDPRGFRAPGIGERRSRASVFLNIADEDHPSGLHLFFERAKLDGDPGAMIEKNIAPGVYYGGGAGWAF